MDTGTITTTESGVDVIVEWKIGHYFIFTEKDGAQYWSPEFSFGGERWYLRIFPNDSSRNDSSEHVNLELLKDFSDRSIKQSFSLSLKTVKGKKYNETHGSQNFHDNNYYHSLYRFITRSELSSRRLTLMPDGTLTVICMMKSSVSSESASNTASAKCRHCKGTFNADNLSSHQKKCMHRPIKCPDCLEVVVLQKWFDEHECQQERPEAGKHPEHPCVEVSTQTVEASTRTVDDSIETVEEKSGKHPEHPCVAVSTQTVEASTRTVDDSIETVEEKCEACASGSFIGPRDDELCHDLKELFLKREDCDIIIKVKDSEFPAHRIILKARSPVFVSTFRHDMKENTTGVLEIEDCDSSTFSDFLCFLYCGDVGIISQENVFGLFTAADKYQVLKLGAKCLAFMKKNITVDTFCETLTLALRHSETELIKLCTDYFKKNIPKIIVTVKWQIFLAENPTESNELLVKCFVPNSS